MTNVTTTPSTAAPVVHGNYNVFAEWFSAAIKQNVVTAIASVKQGRKLVLVRLKQNNLFEQYLNGFLGDRRQEANCNCCRDMANHLWGLAYINDKYEIVPFALPEPVRDYLEGGEAEETMVAYAGVYDAFKAKLNAKSGWELVFREDLIRNKFKMGFRPATVGGYLHPAVEDQTLFTALSNVTATKPTTGGLGDAERETAHNWLNELLRLKPEAKGIAFDDLRPRDLETYQWLLSIVDAVEHVDRGLLVFKLLGESGHHFIQSRNSVVGTFIRDLLDGRPYEAARKSYLDYVDPEHYKRSTALPEEKAMEASMQFMIDNGYAEALPVHLSIWDEVVEAVSEIIECKKKVAPEVDTKSDVFAAIRKDKVSAVQTEYQKRDRGAISLAALCDIIRKDTFESIRIGGVNSEYQAAMWSTTDAPDGGRIYKDGKNTHVCFTPVEPARLSVINQLFNGEFTAEAEAVSFTLSNMGAEQPILLFKEVEVKHGYAMPVFADNLIGELYPHRKTVAHWANKTPVHFHEEAGAVVTVGLVLNAGHLVYVKTSDGFETAYQITALK
ncbi:MAG: hypothetical protein [Bacteriophage sp.]|nr:MAG: hypothetical protein [Bacteriophage sp.]